MSPGRTQSYSFLPLPTRLQALASLPAQIRLRPSALLPGVVAPEALASLYARRQLPGLVPLFHHPVGLRVPLRRAARVTDVRSTPGNTVLRLENLWAEVLKLPPQTLPPLSDLAMSTSVGESTPSTSVETPIQCLLHSHSKRHYRIPSRGTSWKSQSTFTGLTGGLEVTAGGLYTAVAVWLNSTAEARISRSFSFEPQPTITQRNAHATLLGLETYTRPVRGHQ